MKEFRKQIEKWIEENCLLEFVVNIRKIGKKTFIGRIIMLNNIEKSLLIYIDDKKCVESFSFYEIDEIISTSSNNTKVENGIA